MKRGLIAGAVTVFALIIALDSNSQGGDKKDPVTIKVIMRKGLDKGGLLEKVLKKTASDDEKKQFVELIEALAATKCPRGDEDSWKEKTTALLAAAKGDDLAALSKASNCKACHSEHKVKK
jgi:hypothetical protein